MNICPRCGAEKRQQRYGKNRSGSEKYRCGLCNKKYTPSPAKHEYSEQEKTAAIRMYYEGNSARAVGRIQEMSKANVLRWIRERAEKLPPVDPKTAESTTTPVDVIELDELFHYIKKKS